MQYKYSTNNQDKYYNNGEIYKMVFRDHYDKLSDVQKDILRKRVLEESGMAYATFYYKLRTDSFKPLEMKLITEIINSLFK